MKFLKSVTVLYSEDISRSLEYYMNVLGFKDQWTWGDPPDFAGISKDEVEIFFCLKGQGSPGTWLSIMVDNVDEYYESIKSKGAKILSAPETYEWNMREILVEDPDGHKIRFGHNTDCD